MSIAAYIPLVIALPEIVQHASSAQNAWTEIGRRMAAVEANAPFVVADIDAEVSTVAAQVRDVFAAAPPPQDVRLLYFGLFAAADTTSREERAGYHVAGSTRDLPPVEESGQLAGNVLDYRPARRSLESPLLQRIKAAASADELHHDLFDYVWMLAAAAVLSLFATRQLGLQVRLIVGFDSGDALDFGRVVGAPHA